MTCVLAIASERDTPNVLGTRHSAMSFRDCIERQLATCSTVQIDFTGAYVTQAFVDELLGSLILRMGSDALHRLEFSGCSDEAKAILRLVIAGRLRDYSARQVLCHSQVGALPVGN